MGGESDSSGRKTGRPRKSEGPRVPYDEVDRLLVFGEVVRRDDGTTTVVYPSYRDLAGRFGCAHSLIAQYSRKHNCLRRRKEAKARVAVKAEQKLVEMRATAVALSKDDALRMIDTYLVGFEQALSEGRVRYDNPTDFNTMLRLKEFILGGADSRQEIHAALSLEDIQARHQRMLRASQQASAEERGEMQGALLPGEDEDEHLLPGNSPAPPAEVAAGEVPVQPPPDPDDGEAQPLAHVRASRGGRGAWDDEADGARAAPQGANVAPTGPSSAAAPPEAASAAMMPGAEGAEGVCASSGPGASSLAGADPPERPGTRRPRSSAAFRPSGGAGGQDDETDPQHDRVLPGPGGPTVAEGSRASREHPRRRDGVS